MTGTEKITKRIIEDAEAKARIIEEQARQEARALMEQARADASQKREELLKKAEADGEESYKRLIAVAGLEGRKEILRAKQEMIDEAFQKALEKVCRLKDQDYQSLLEKMIADAAGDEGGEILLSEKDAKRMDYRFIENINQRIAGSGKKGTVTLSAQRIKTAGGFVLKNGEREINSTFEILFGMLRTELESDVVRMLFQS